MDKELKDTAVAAMRDLILAAEAYRQTAAARLGLNLTDSQAVSYLLARGPMGQNDLATALGITTGSVTPLVDRLERDGIARRRPHPTDRRRTIVDLSPDSKAALDQAQSWLLAAFTDIDPDDLPGVTRTLQTLAAGLRQQASSAAGSSATSN